MKCIEEGCTETAKENFYKKSGRPGLFMSRCKVHHNTRRAALNRLNKQKIVEYKGGKCHVCGYSRCASALELHHLDPAQKDPDYTKIRNRALAVLQEEADKCVLLCANCHREVHAGCSLVDSAGLL